MVIKAIRHATPITNPVGELTPTAEQLERHKVTCSGKPECSQFYCRLVVYVPSKI
jgi:hypothetical protein